MGTWDVGPFDNDTAADFCDDLDEAAPSEREGIIRSALMRVIDTAGYLEAPESEVAVAAAALVAAQCPGGRPADPADGPEEPLPDVTRLSDLAVQALDRVMTEPSELTDLWAQSDGGHWRARVNLMRATLLPQLPGERLAVDDRRLPEAVAAAMAVPFNYDGGSGVDFEPFTTFLSAEDTTDWFQAWTGNLDLNGDDFRVFGQDGSGGYAAFWLAHPHRDLVDQPIVFLGSEGETGVIARNMSDFLWLLADGFGPYEAATSPAPDWVPQPNQQLRTIAERFAPDLRHSAARVVELASREFPDFDDTIVQLCR